MNHKKTNYPTPSSPQLTMFEREVPYPTPEPVAKETPAPKPVTAKPDTNANREGYKPTKLGWIPEEWEVKGLGKIAKVTSGGTPSREKEAYWNGSIPWVTTTLIDFNEISEAEECITEEGLKNSSAKLFYPSTILMALYGQGKTRGKVGILKIKAATNQACAAIVFPENKIESIFVFFYLVNNYTNIRNLSNTGNQENLNGGLVKLINIPLPPLPEQRAIADCLSTWDRAIQTLTQLIAQRELRKKWLMQQLLTGKKRLPGFGGEWSTWSFKEILKEVKRPVSWNDEQLYDLISVRRRSGGLFHRESLYGHQIKTKNLRTAKSGDFLISKMQIVHGASGLTTNKFDGMKISGSYIAVRARNEDILNTEFLNWYSRLPHFYHQCYISSYGVHIEKMTFDFKLFLKEEIKLPSIDEQTVIAQVLHRADHEITLLSQKLTHLQDQKKGLMQQLLTGKKRLK
ncbi:MAG: restriction endonuclease subunit S [Tunicatimonas sp.]